MGVHKITVLAVAAMVFAGGAGAEDATPPRAALGRITFALSCAVCHGQTATGEGAMSSDLAVPAPDLTLLSVRNGGTFPAERVTEIIFGGAAVTVHGGQMPAWGLLFLKDFEAPDGNAPRDGAALVERRIGDLVAYLESIQELESADEDQPD